MKNLLFFLFLSTSLFVKSQYCGTVSSNVNITPSITTQNTPTYSDGRRAFNFTAEVGGIYTFSTVGLSSVDTYLRLYSTGTGGVVIAVNDDASTNPLITQSTLVWECTSSGIYSVHLSRWRNNGNQCDPLNGSTSMSYVVDYPIPLPVTLTSFTTECENGIPSLKWTTASEQNSDYFQIERSRDGFEWGVISQVNAMGNSNTTKNYQFYDMTSGGNFDGYYRIKQVDFDGNFEYFEPKTINCLINNVDPNVEIFPNPVKSELFIGVKNSIVGDGDITVTDFSGKIIKRDQVILSQGYNLIEINTRGLLSGIYIIKVVSNDIKFVGKFVKH
jgi:hypothetical protein